MNRWLLILIATSLVACDLTGGYNPLETTPVSPPPRQLALLVKAITYGTNPDSDGYAAVVNNGAPQELGPTCGQNTLCWSFPVMPGDQTVALHGLAGNCTTGNNPRVVQVSSSNANTALFTVMCP